MPHGPKPADDAAVPSALSVRVVDGLDKVEAAAWDAVAGADHPFVSHRFLRLLEESGSVGSKSGWLPRHLTLRDAAGRLVGASPVYVKNHSYGEYVFDHAWANAWERAGGEYYPKLQVSVPFTPVTGPRLMLHPDAPEGSRLAMIRTLEQVTVQNGLSSAHITFPTAAEHVELGDAGWLLRIGTQFHWENKGYKDFDDFLGSFSSRKRKGVRKERREVAESNLTLHTITGPDLKPEHMEAFYRFYTATSDRKWGWAYLTRDFFMRLATEMSDRVVLVLAADDGEWVAGALNLLGTDCLYGRNWGCVGDYKHLHFEACYYRAIDFAIERGLKRVEAGAQGAHKIQRGYLPVPTYSAHFIPNPGFRRAIADFLVQERAAMAQEMALLAAESPYRCDGDRDV